MDSNTLLADPATIRLEHIVSHPTSLVIVVTAVRRQADCPKCQRISSCVHSHYQRTVADLPWQGVSVRLELHTRRFRCLNDLCERSIFCERMPSVVAHYARQTARLTSALELIGFAIGGEAGVRVARELAMATSPDTLLRRIRQAIPEEHPMADFEVGRTAVSDGALRYYVRQGHGRGRSRATSSETEKPLLCAPIAYDGRFLGTRAVRSDDPFRIWDESQVQAFLAIAHQIWEAVNQARLFAEKEQQSLTDALTGCLNRRGFDLRLESALHLAAETGQPLSLVMVDIDHFKPVNDTYGHAAGDQVLRVLAGILREEIDGGLTAARYGGEEFALILPQLEIGEASTLVLCNVSL